MLAQSLNEILQIMVPASIQQQVMMDYHSGCLAGHFSGACLYKMLACKSWWKYMYWVTLEYAKKCPQCAIVKGTGR